MFQQIFLEIWLIIVNHLNCWIIYKARNAWRCSSNISLHRTADDAAANISLYHCDVLVIKGTVMLDDAAANVSLYHCDVLVIKGTVMLDEAAANISLYHCDVLVIKGTVICNWMPACASACQLTAAATHMHERNQEHGRGESPLVTHTSPCKPYNKD